MLSYKLIVIDIITLLYVFKTISMCAYIITEYSFLPNTGGSTIGLLPPLGGASEKGFILYFCISIYCNYARMHKSNVLGSGRGTAKIICCLWVKIEA